MPFALLIARNLLRQRTRTFLTILGMSVGITAVVALGVITHSAIAASGEILTAGGADFSIGRQGSADLTFSILTGKDVEAVEAYREVEHVSGVLLAFSQVGSNPFFIQVGIDSEDLEHFNLPLVAGRRLAAGALDEAMLGSRAASELKAGVGDRVTVRDHVFTVVGVYRAPEVFVDSGAILPLAAVQDYERKEGLYSLLYVHVREGVDVKALARRIEAENPQLVTLMETGDISKVDQGPQIISAVNMGVTILAVFVGGLAVMNTMVMAVFERTREFGILRAIGWRTRRIIQMVVGESLLLCLVSVAFGSLLAVLLTRAILLVPIIRAFLEPQYPLDVFLRGLAVGVGVALLGAIYPALRAAGFSPAQAIRYE